MAELSSLAQSMMDHVQDEAAHRAGRKGRFDTGPTGTEHLHPSQFGKHRATPGKHEKPTPSSGIRGKHAKPSGGAHRSVFSSSNPSFGTRVKEDMARRQGGIKVGAHAKPGKHAKPYSAEEDIATSMSGKKEGYKAKHDVLGLNKPKSAKGKISAPDKKTPGRNKFNVHKAIAFKSKHEGKNQEHIRALVK